MDDVIIIALKYVWFSCWQCWTMGHRWQKKGSILLHTFGHKWSNWSVCSFTVASETNERPNRPEIEGKNAQRQYTMVLMMMTMKNICYSLMLTIYVFVFGWDSFLSASAQVIKHCSPLQFIVFYFIFSCLSSLRWKRWEWEGKRYAAEFPRCNLCSGRKLICLWVTLLTDERRPFPRSAQRVIHVCVCDYDRMSNSQHQMSNEYCVRSCQSRKQYFGMLFMTLHNNKWKWYNIV